MLINWGQKMSINMLNMEFVLFRSISSVSLLLSLYEISQCALHALNKESVLFRLISSISLLLSLYEISQYALYAAIITKKSHVWLGTVHSFTLSVFLWQNNTTLYFSVSLKLAALCMTGQWSGFTIKRLIYVFIYFFWHYFVVFYHKICVFIIFISFFDEVSNFRNRIQESIRNKNLQSKVGIGTVCLSTS